MAIMDLLSGALNATGERPSLPDGRTGRMQTEQADVYVGADASTERLREDLRRYSIVHLATHGAVDASDPSRSGLVLATAGHDDDGFLSVPEVLDLDLDADLVVLSACDTARGAVRRGEGVQSLAWAFLYAGARGVIATLWQVDDRETEVAMREFYRGLRQRGLDAGASLQQARLMLRHAAAGSGAFAGTGRGKLLPGAPQRAAPAGAPARERRGHPYFWAPFISIGPAR
jgi:CHAT domain-containing protein